MGRCSKKIASELCFFHRHDRHNHSDVRLLYGAIMNIAKESSTHLMLKSPMTSYVRGFLFERFSSLQNIFDMTGHSHLAPDPGDFTIRVYQECSAFDAEILASVHGFLNPHSKSF